jgi:hypothetical protein
MEQKFANINDCLVKNITSILVEGGAFINFINTEILQSSIGHICFDGDNTKILGVLLGVKIEPISVIKYLIIFITGEKKKILLKIFLETLKDQYNLGPNWQFVLVPLFSQNDKYELSNICESFKFSRFIDYCRSQGMKIFDSTFFPIKKNLLDPVELYEKSDGSAFYKKIIDKWFMPIDRSDYIDSQGLIKDIFKLGIKDQNIIKTIVAQFLLSIVESYDYRVTIDIEEKLNPYLSFKKDEQIRNSLRSYVSEVFSNLMGEKNLRGQKSSKKPYPPEKFWGIQQDLEQLFKNLMIPDLTEYLLSQGVFKQFEPK